MKFIAILVTAALFGAMGWLVMDARMKASTAELKLELFKEIQANRNAGAQSAMQVTPAPAPAPAPAPVAATVASVPVAPGPLPANALESAVKEKELLENGAMGFDDPSNIPPPMGTPGMQVANPAEVAAAPAPEPTTRQRLVAKATLLGNVQEYAKEHGFLVITPKEGALITKNTTYSIRRGDSVIAKIKVSEIEDGSVIADIDPSSIAPGVDIVLGDEVIENLGGATSR